MVMRNGTLILTKNKILLTATKIFHSPDQIEIASGTILTTLIESQRVRGRRRVCE